MIVAASNAGCISRQDLEAYAVNESSSTVELYVVLTETASGAEAYNMSANLDPGQRIELNGFPPEASVDYSVHAWVPGGAAARDELSWSKATGPDEFGIQVRNERIEFLEVIV